MPGKPLEKGILTLFRLGPYPAFVGGYANLIEHGDQRMSLDHAPKENICFLVQEQICPMTSEHNSLVETRGQSFILIICTLWTRRRSFSNIHHPLLPTLRINSGPDPYAPGRVVVVGRSKFRSDTGSTIMRTFCSTEIFYYSQQRSTYRRTSSLVSSS